MHAALARDGVRLSDLSGKLDGGELTGLFEARNNDGTTLVSTQFKLAGADLGQVLDGSGLTGSGDITASLSASGKSVEALVASLSGSGTAAVKDARIPGINPDAFPALLVGADRVGREIDAARTAAFAPAIVSAGTFVAPPAQIAFTVAAGVLRAPPVTLDAGAASVRPTSRPSSAPAWWPPPAPSPMRPGDDALVGSEPAVRFAFEGPLGAMSGKFDTEPLAQFLTQRALEREQARVEAMQSALLEKQRLRREVRYYASLQFEHDNAPRIARKAEEEAARSRGQAQGRGRGARPRPKRSRSARRKRRRPRPKRRGEAEAKAKAEAERSASARSRPKQAAEAAQGRGEERARPKSEAEARKARAEEQRRREARSRRGGKRRRRGRGGLQRRRRSKAAEPPGGRSQRLQDGAVDSCRAPSGEKAPALRPAELGDFLKSAAGTRAVSVDVGAAEPLNAVRHGCRRADVDGQCEVPAMAVTSATGAFPPLRLLEDENPQRRGQVGLARTVPVDFRDQRGERDAARARRWRADRRRRAVRARSWCGGREW